MSKSGSVVRDENVLGKDTFGQKPSGRPLSSGGYIRVHIPLNTTRVIQCYMMQRLAATSICVQTDGTANRIFVMIVIYVICHLSEI